MGVCSAYSNKRHYFAAKHCEISVEGRHASSKTYTLNGGQAVRDEAWLGVVMSFVGAPMKNLRFKLESCNTL